MRDALMHIETLQGLRDILGTLDPAEPFPVASMRVTRGKTGGVQTVSLPPGFLDQLDDDTPPEPEGDAEAEGG
jgi:hypothetical protein